MVAGIVHNIVCMDAGRSGVVLDCIEPVWHRSDVVDKKADEKVSKQAPFRGLFFYSCKYLYNPSGVCIKGAFIRNARFDKLTQLIAPLVSNTAGALHGT